MSFDVFLQAFRDGDAASVDAARVLDALTQCSTEPVTPDSERIHTTDGEAQVFGLDTAADGFMINHASGAAIWDTIVHVADTTGMAILPVGCPICVTRPEHLDHLPDELRSDARVVTSGTQLAATFRLIAGLG
jgi:hypothetical protein